MKSSTTSCLKHRATEIFFITSPQHYIIRKIKSRRIRWAGHVARWGREGMHIGYRWESQKERDHWEDHDVGGWTILKWNLER
jgi:hypothetical protein